MKKKNDHGVFAAVRMAAASHRLLTVGTHEELMASVPLYRQLYESQTAAKGGGPA